MKHGAALVVAQSAPSLEIALEQHDDLPPSANALHPDPPHCCRPVAGLMQSSSQHITPLELEVSMPGTPLLHVAVAGVGSTSCCAASSPIMANTSKDPLPPALGFEQWEDDGSVDERVRGICTRTLCMRNDVF